MFAKIKSYALLILSGLAISLAFLSQWLISSRRRLKRENEQLEANNEFKDHVMEKDVEITEQTRSRRVDALKELEDTGSSDVFLDPNKLRDRND